MAGIHIPGEVLGRSLAEASFDSASETFAQDVAEVVHDASVAAIQNGVRTEVAKLEQRVDALRLELADPDREVERYLELVRGG